MYKLPRLAVLLLVLLALFASVGSEAATAPREGHDAVAGLTVQLAQSADRDDAGVLNRAYFIGVWETRNQELGRDVKVIWTVRGDHSLDYDFVVDGVSGRGSTGTWDFRDGVLIENWRRPDGTTGTGRASIEKIDANTFRLTVIDNGDPQYRGVVRIYRRLRGTPIVNAGGALMGTATNLLIQVR